MYKPRPNAVRFCPKPRANLDGEALISIVGVGIDILEIDRVARALQKLGDAFAREWLSEYEYATWQRGTQRVRTLSSSVTAKEAALKGLGTGLADGVRWQDVELLPGPHPSLRLSGAAEACARELGAGNVHVGLAWSKRHAAAAVVLESIRGHDGGLGDEGVWIMKDVLLGYIRNEYLDQDDEDWVIDENTPLISSGIIDSFSMVSLKRFIEKRYGVAIPDAEASADAFDTVTRIISLIEKHRKGA
jgi:holo-[acyl-carrier protein] synthase